MTVIDSPPLSDSPAPTDPDELDAWLDAWIETYRLAVLALLDASVDAAWAGFVGEPITAGLADAEQATRFIWESGAPGLLEMEGDLFRGGALGARLTAPGAAIPPMGDWSVVVNTRAADYLAGAANRLVLVGDTTWDEVRKRLTAGIQDGLTREQMKEQIEEVAGFNEFRADTIARTEVMGAYNHGHLDGALALGDAGPVMKSWHTTRDGRTRPSHADANRQTVPLREPFIVGGSRLMHPGDVNGPAEEVINCRCTPLFHYPGDMLPDGTVLPPRKPAAWAPPAPPANFRDSGKAPPGGQNPKSILTDTDTGEDWLFKPQDDWIAHGEAAAAEVARRIGLGAADVRVGSFQGRTGSMQKMLPDARRGFPGDTSAFDPTRITADDLADIQRHRVLDWAISNHDGHSEQYVRLGYANQGGRLVGIDKGQAFKFWGKDKLDHKYAPNAFANGSHTPAANLIERAYVEGRMDARAFRPATGATSPTAQTARALEAIPDDEYRAIWRTYAEGRFGPGQAAEDFLDGIVARKNSLTTDFKRYHDRLYTARRKAVAPQKPIGGAGGPKGMQGALKAQPSRAGTGDMARADSPVKSLDSDGFSYATYTGGSYSDINRPLRAGGVPKGSLRGITETMRANMKPVKIDFYSYRGGHVEQFAPGGDMTALQGSVLRDRAFLSTSVGDEGAAFGGDTAFIIRNTDQGKGGRYIHPVSSYDDEREYLIADDQPLYVHAVRRFNATEFPTWKNKGYKWVVEVETVNDKWAAAAGVRTWDTNLQRWA